MATTSNFGWETPDDTDYVKDGAAAMRTLGNAIDTSMADLKGGTTGQVLSKATNTDMDFVWVAQDDSNAIQNAIIDAKGDLIAGSAADTPVRVAVGTDGQVLVADSTATGGVKWATSVSGGMTLIATATPSGATTVSFTSIPTTYKQLRIVWQNVYQNSTGDGFYVLLNNDTGSNYDYKSVLVNANGSFTYTSQTAQNGFGRNSVTVMPIPNGTTSSTNYSLQTYGQMDFFRADQTEGHAVRWETMAHTGTNNPYGGIFWGWYSGTAAAITQIDFVRSSTQTVTGKFYLYGIN